MKWPWSETKVSKPWSETEEKAWSAEAKWNTTKGKYAYYVGICYLDEDEEEVVDEICIHDDAPNLEAYYEHFKNMGALILNLKNGDRILIPKEQIMYIREPKK